SVGHEVCKIVGSQLKGTKLLKEVFKHLVNERLITKSESTDLQDLLQHRNKIAHDVQSLIGDIEIPGRNYRFRNLLKLQYDYQALERIKRWENELEMRLSKNYWLSASYNTLLFEAADLAYGKELATLKRRIDRQLLVR